MTTLSIARTFVVAGLALGTLWVLRSAVCADEPAPPAAGAYKLSGPFTHENLTIFLIHGEDQLKGKTPLTLQEALEQKKVVVHEVGRDIQAPNAPPIPQQAPNEPPVPPQPPQVQQQQQGQQGGQQRQQQIQQVQGGGARVNELAIENVSDEEVFIQAGDIVKGGQQDRTISIDIILPPKSGKVSLNVFCVESGRWRQRGQEDAAKFDKSTDNLPNNASKIAARQSKNQGEVWKEIEKSQKQLEKNVGKSVQSAESATSLQLTLENKHLREAVEAYVKKLAPIVEGKNDVIGYAVAINGKMNNADIYASSALFKKLWPKLLKSSAVEAVAEMKKDAKFEPVAAETVQAFLADAEKGKASETEVSKRIKTITRESDKRIMFETRDLEKKEMPALRKSILEKK